MVAEDEPSLRESLVDSLTESSYAVTEAANGKIARDIFGLQDFDLVLTDVQMPFLDGIALLKWIKATRPTPIVMMTGFTNLIEAKKAYELGVTDFLTKPFTKATLLDTIQKVFRTQPTNVAVEEEEDSSFCRVSIDEFVSKSKIEFDVFVRLSKDKFVKIGVAGSDIPLDRIHNYQKKGVEHLYVRHGDFAKLVNFNLALSKVVVKNDSISREKKINFMKYTGEVILEKAFVQGVDKQSFDDAKDMLVSTVNVLGESPQHLALLDVLNSHSDWIYAHSVAASMFALMIARRMKISQSQVFFKLGMAGLFHEIGYKEIPRELLEKARPLLTQVERTMVESHVTRSRDILAEIKGVPNEVIEIVYQHHEDILGHGFPRRLKRDQIHPLARIFQVADAFADAAVKSPGHPGMQSSEAIVHVEAFQGDKLDKDAFMALKGIFTQNAKK